MTHFLTRAYLLLLLISVPLAGAEKIPTVIYTGPMSDIGWESRHDKVTLRLYPDRTATLTGTVLHGAGTLNLRWEERGAVATKEGGKATGIALLNAQGSQCWALYYQQGKAVLVGHSVGFVAALTCLVVNTNPPYVGSTVDSSPENTFK